MPSSLAAAEEKSLRFWRANHSKCNGALLLRSCISTRILPLFANLFARADILSEDLFQKELAMEECLDAAIDRAVKRLVQAKAMKQMLASPSLNRQLNGQTQQPKRISASNRAEPQPSTQEH